MIALQELYRIARKHCPSIVPSIKLIQDILEMSCSMSSNDFESWRQQPIFHRERIQGEMDPFDLLEPSNPA